MQPTEQQESIASSSIDRKTFLRGIAGAGKTTTGVMRLEHLLGSGIPANQILVMIPQRTLGFPYYDLLDAPGITGAAVNVLTLGGIARRAVDIFWPMVAEEHGFAQPERRPTFLSLETAQYFMARVAGPVIDKEKYFDTVTIDRNRLYSQVIDNLNKAAVVDDFEYTDIAARLKAAWGGDHDQARMYDDVQACANLFRAYCLEHNLLDFSLQVELYIKRLRDLPQVRDWLRGLARHVIADNIEEDTPAAHDELARLVANAESALLIFDEEAGYRRFLGADDKNALRLAALCDETVQIHDSLVMTPPIEAFNVALSQALDPASDPNDVLDLPEDPREAMAYDDFRYHPQMIDGVAEEIAALVDETGEPGQIVVIAPYMSDALRFGLMNRLERANIPVRSHRPSRSLRMEPAAQAMLTLATLAHPHWRQAPVVFDVVFMLMEAIAGVDLVRAQLLSRYAYKVSSERPQLGRFDAIRGDVQQRVTYGFGEKYEYLRTWLEDYAEGDELPLDHFLSRLFGEVLSQPGFGFHDSDLMPDKDASRIAANLIDSARKFRQMIEGSGATIPDKTIAQEYVAMVTQGVIADQYLAGWDVSEQESVLLAPAYTYLLSNRPVDYQFWLNVGGAGWSERLYQPLTNPYVLTRSWPQDQVWTDEDEFRVGHESLRRLVRGLARRCHKRVYLGFSELGEQGFQQQGDLLQAIQRMLRRLTA